MTVKLTRLITFKRGEISFWLGDPEHLIVGEAYEAIADWADVDLDDVDLRESEFFAGECFTVRGKPVAYLETSFREVVR